MSWSGVQAWVTRVRALSVERMACREARLREQVHGLRSRLAALGVPEEIRERVAAASTRLKELRTRRGELQEASEHLEMKLRARHRALAEQMLRQCEQMLRYGRQVADAEIVREAGLVLDVDLAGASPREAEALAARSGKPAEANAEVAAEIGLAGEALRKTSGRLQVRARLQVERLPLLEEARELERRLRVDHQVGAEALAGLLRLVEADGVACDNLIEQWLAPRVSQLRREDEWGLAQRVLEEAGGGLD